MIANIAHILTERFVRILHFRLTEQICLLLRVGRCNSEDFAIIFVIPHLMTNVYTR